MNEDFIKLFYEESNEQLDLAEEALIAYEREQAISFIEEAFRSLHTIKGAANMFGFTAIGEFAHKVESILDEIREGKVEEPAEMASRLLEFVDHIKMVLPDPNLSQEENKVSHHLMTDEVDALLQSIQNEGQASKHKAAIDTSKFSTFYLHVQAKVKLEKNSGHPVIGVIEELREHGICIITPHYIDQLFDYWDIYIADDTTAEELEMGFMFFDSDVEAKAYRLSGTNLFGAIDFESEIKKIEGLRINEKLEKLNSLIDVVNKNVSKKENAGSKVNLKSTSVRVPSRKIELLMNSVSELVTELASLSMLAEQFENADLINLSERMERHIFNLRDATFDMSLVPVSNIVSRLERIVRDNSKSLGKDVELKVTGSHVEIDKSFLELLADPFMHLLRNSIDHGIEPEDERVALGKTPRGLITLNVYRSGADVVFEISDDGKGLDKEKIRAKAHEKGLIEEDEALTESELYELIFHPGFSTAHEITNISGRGVGMDVVKKNIVALKGSIKVTSQRNVGTTMTIKVPLTLSIIDGLLFSVGDLRLLVPLNEVKKCHNLPLELLGDNVSELLSLDDQLIPYLNLKELFGLEYESEDENINIINVFSAGREICLTADEILGEYQAVIKPVGDHYSDVDYLAGATILGDGAIALVLETNKLFTIKKVSLVDVE